MKRASLVTVIGLECFSYAAASNFFIFHFIFKIFKLYLDSEI